MTMAHRVKLLSYCVLAAGGMFWSGCNGSADSGVDFGVPSNAFKVTKIRFQRSFCRIQTSEAPSAAGYPEGIEVRVQLKDQFDDPIKALGMFRFEIYRYQPAVSDPRGKRFKMDGVQNIILSDVPENQKHWDNITCSYHMKLAFPPEAGKDKKIVLQATFTMNSGYRLRDILILETQP